MKFICLNESCGKLFVYPAKLRKPILESYQPSGLFEETETHVCPYCGSLDIEEYTPEPLPQQVEEIANVYIYDLTTGPQTQLDKLLADGYKIVNRYSKQYHLEKPKTPVDANPTEVKA